MDGRTVDVSTSRKVVPTFGVNNNNFGNCCPQQQQQQQQQQVPCDGVYSLDEEPEPAETKPSDDGGDRASFLVHRLYTNRLGNVKSHCRLTLARTRGAWWAAKGRGPIKEPCPV